MSSMFISRIQIKRFYKRRSPWMSSNVWQFWLVCTGITSDKVRVKYWCIVLFFFCVFFVLYPFFFFLFNQFFSRMALQYPMCYIVVLGRLECHLLYSKWFLLFECKIPETTYGVFHSSTQSYEHASFYQYRYLRQHLLLRLYLLAIEYLGILLLIDNDSEKDGRAI